MGIRAFRVLFFSTVFALAVSLGSNAKLHAQDEHPKSTPPTAEQIAIECQEVLDGARELQDEVGELAQSLELHVPPRQAMMLARRAHAIDRADYEPLQRSGVLARGILRALMIHSDIESRKNVVSMLRGFQRISDTQAKPLIEDMIANIVDELGDPISLQGLVDTPEKARKLDLTEEEYIDLHSMLDEWVTLDFAPLRAYLEEFLFVADASEIESVANRYPSGFAKIVSALGGIFALRKPKFPFNVHIRPVRAVRSQNVLSADELVFSSQPDLREQLENLFKNASVRVLEWQVRRNFYQLSNSEVHSILDHPKSRHLSEDLLRWLADRAQLMRRHLEITSQERRLKDQLKKTEALVEWEKKRTPGGMSSEEFDVLRKDMQKMAEDFEYSHYSANYKEPELRQDYTQKVRAFQNLLRLFFEQYGETLSTKQYLRTLDLVIDKGTKLRSNYSDYIPSTLEIFVKKRFAHEIPDLTKLRIKSLLALSKTVANDTVAALAREIESRLTESPLPNNSPEGSALVREAEQIRSELESVEYELAALRVKILPLR